MAVFFVAGAEIRSPFLLLFYYSYFADLVIPFGFYFLLVLNEHRLIFLKPWWAKALLVFSLCATSEALQFFGIFALARVFDPWIL
ncbi:hypothetical protein MUP65_02640 [Patescibacteria group bacterium]|nr:hypothetical protein [Patescibacteria group bacterium]